MRKISVVAENIPRESRRNPQALRELIAHLINTHFDGQIKKTCDELKTLRKRTGTEKAITRTVIEGLLKDQSPIHYQYLEAFANHVGVPTFVLLAFSRAYSDRKYIAAGAELKGKKDISEAAEIRRDAENAKRNLNDMMNFFQSMASLVEKHSFDMDDFDQWVKIYNGDGQKADEEQRSLI